MLGARGEIEVLGDIDQSRGRSVELDLDCFRVRDFSGFRVDPNHDSVKVDRRLFSFDGSVLSWK